MSVDSASVSATLQRSRSADTFDWWRERGASVSATRNIADVADVWRQLETNGIESPGQSLDFTRAWIETFKIPEDDQMFVTGSFEGQVVALLPLKRKQKHGVTIYTWFAGAHVGCNAPLIDRGAFDSMSVAERTEFWRRMQRGLAGADMVWLDAMPDFGEAHYFDGLGRSQPSDVLYRSEFDSWDDCDSIQRSRTRRKHDRQQGAKLDAMGEVSFEELTDGPEAVEAVLTMFRQKAKRFKEWGIEDPFADPVVQKFYTGLLGRTTGLQARVHVLKLSGEIVSVRYNLVQGQRAFALISSMSDDENLSPGSPGKQNLLRAQIKMFSDGLCMVDMGAGYSDEKRHWCNVTIPVRDHILALTARGRLAARIIGWRTWMQRRIKEDQRMFNTVKNFRSFAGNFGKRD